MSCKIIHLLRVQRTVVLLQVVYASGKFYTEKRFIVTNLDILGKPSQVQGFLGWQIEKKRPNLSASSRKASWTDHVESFGYLHSITAARKMQSSTRAGKTWSYFWILCQKGFANSRIIMVIKKYTVSWPIWWLSLGAVESLSHVWLFFDPMDWSLLGSSVLEISQAGILEWVAIFSSKESSRHRDQTHISCFGRHILYCWTIKEAQLPFIFHQR